MPEPTKPPAFDQAKEKFEFFLDDLGEPTARFKDEQDQRTFSLNSIVIKAELYGFLNGKGKDRAEMDALVYRCVREATKHFRPKSERDDELMEDESLVYAFVKRAWNNGKDGGWIDDEPTMMRKNLVEEVAEAHPEADKQWKTGAHFTKDVKKFIKAGVFKAHNLEVVCGRSGLRRFIKMRWIDVSKIPEYKDPPPPKDPKGEEEGETLPSELFDPSPGKPGDAAAAQKAPVASPTPKALKTPKPGNATVAQSGPVASLPAKGEKKTVRERTHDASKQQVRLGPETEEVNELDAPSQQPVQVDPEAEEVADHVEDE